MSVGDGAQLCKLQQWLDEDFGSLAVRIFPLCLSDDGTEPIGYHFFFVAKSAIRVEIGEHEEDFLLRAFVYLVAFYFCVDSVADNHPRANTTEEPIARVVPYLGSLLTGSISNFLRALSPELGPVLLVRLNTLLRDNAFAIENEQVRTQDPNPTDDRDRKNIVGRTNALSMIFYVLYLVSGNEVDVKLMRLVEDCAYFAQLGDDLSDWYEDFRGRRLTPFLRECIREIAPKAVPVSEHTLERHIYLQGKYETYVDRIITGLDDVAARCRSGGYPEFGGYVGRIRDTASRERQAFIFQKHNVTS